MSLSHRKLGKQADVDEHAGSDDSIAFMHAMKSKDFSSLRSCLSRSDAEDLLLYPNHNESGSVLHYAMREADFEVFKFLVTHPQCTYEVLNFENDRGFTCLDLVITEIQTALRSGKQPAIHLMKIAKLLLSHPHQDILSSDKKEENTLQRILGKTAPFYPVTELFLHPRIQQHSSKADRFVITFSTKNRFRISLPAPLRKLANFISKKLLLMKKKWASPKKPIALSSDEKTEIEVGMDQAIKKFNQKHISTDLKNITLETIPLLRRLHDTLCKQKIDVGLHQYYYDALLKSYLIENRYACLITAITTLKDTHPSLASTLHHHISDYVRRHLSSLFSAQSNLPPVKLNSEKPAEETREELAYSMLKTIQYDYLHYSKPVSFWAKGDAYHLTTKKTLTITEEELRDLEEIDYAKNNLATAPWSLTLNRIAARAG